MRVSRPLRAAAVAACVLAAGTAAVAATTATTSAVHADPAGPAAAATSTTAPSTTAPPPVTATSTAEHDTEGGSVRAAAVPRATTAGVTRRTYRTPDGVSATGGTVVSFVNAARDRAAAGSASVPWIAWVHGGGWIKGDPGDAAAGYFCNHAAALGIACFSLGYTLTPTAHWPTQLTEVAAELEWVRAHAATFHLDPYAGFLFGHSAGALMAGAAGLDSTEQTSKDTGTASPQLAGIGLMDGATDVPSIIAGNFRPSVSGYARTLVRWTSAAAPGTAATASVAAHVPAQHSDVPVLLLHDAADPVVDARLSIRLAATLQDAGYPTTLDLLPGATHFTEYDATALAAVDAWVAGRLAVVDALHPVPATSWSPPSTVGLTLSATSATVGGPVTATAVVHGSNGPALGTVTVYRDGVRVGSAAMSSGSAVVRLSAPAVPGSYRYTARYAGRTTAGHGWGSYAAATSPAHTLTVHAKAAPTVTLTVARQVAPGATVRAAVRVSGTAGTPTGGVALISGGAVVVRAVLVAGRATLTYRAGTAGTSRVLAARYTGSAQYAARSSKATTVTVRATTGR